MIQLAAILTAIGAGDILRVLLLPRMGTRRVHLLLVLVSAAVLTGLGLIAAAPWWLVLGSAVPVVLWFTSVPIGPEAPKRPIRAALPGLLGFIVLSAVVTILADSSLAATGTQAGLETIGRFSVESLALATGIGLFHTAAANALVRVALDGEQSSAGAAGEVLMVTRPQLKGGRWIGPLERIALTGLLAAGAFPVAAGLIAAKGIVRFPEMHQDRAHGDKSEYFLVGSFVSWTVAIIAAGLLWLGH